MRDVRRAEFVEWVREVESAVDYILDVRGATWAEQREYALVETVDGMALIKGGRDGIELVVDGSGQVVLSVGVGEVRVLRLVWHTHPKSTGPSDADHDVLRLLGQAESRLFEPGSPRTGQVFKADLKEKGP